MSGSAIGGESGWNEPSGSGSGSGWKEPSGSGSGSGWKELKNGWQMGSDAS